MARGLTYKNIASLYTFLQVILQDFSELGEEETVVSHYCTYSHTHARGIILALCMLARVANIVVAVVVVVSAITFAK